MKLSVAVRLLSSWPMAFAMVAMAAVATSCESMVYEEEGDCELRNHLVFRFTKNVLDADAFGPQVTEINLALYDKSGRLVMHHKENREPTTANDFYIDVDVPAGKYDAIAWCGGRALSEDAVSFTLSGQSDGDSMTASVAQLPLVSDGNTLCSDRDIRRLYHGLVRDIVVADTFGTVELGPIYLTKDTNHITVSLQNIDGGEIDPRNISIELEGRNSNLAWDNSLAGDTKFIYRPWSQVATTASLENAVGAGIMAELTTGRIMADVEQTLTVKKRDSGDTILSIPLVEYLLLVRGNYTQASSDQDYLDRCDDYTMVFFLQEGTWMKSRILINGWRVVPPQSGIL